MMITRIDGKSWMLGAIILAGVAGWAAFGGSTRPASAEDAPPPVASERSAPVDFVRDIQPIFQQSCYKCHDAARHKGGLRLDSKATAFVGGDSGDPSLLPHDPEHSKMIGLVRGDDPNSVMPPKGERLNKTQVDLLTRWVTQGAIWPDGIDTPAAALKHWSFIKPVRADLPAVANKEWVRNPIDQFVLARLEQEGLSPSPEANRYTLCRRLYLDLIGLPPTIEQSEAFARDESPDAYEKLVDRLQGNPHYGERWARPWLDVARYADSAGYGSDPLRKTCSRYRDWVISAFNRNLPFDQFTVEQLAGDLLPNPTTDQLIATCFNRNTMTNTEGGTDREEFRTAAVKDRVDTTIQSWMGLTMGCAQCHTHKYDPITNREYYQLFAIFNQTADADRQDEAPTIETPTPDEISRLNELKGKLAAAEKRPEPAAYADAQAAWEKSVAAEAADWTPLDLVSAKAASGADLAKQPDGSVLASGIRSASDTYTLTAHTDMPGVTAFRIETIPDESLPHHGSGRADDGSFVLTHLNVQSQPPRAALPVGQIVRIQLYGHEQILHLAEVQVFHGDENIALKGKASQSTTDFGGKPEYAIDGITDGNFAKHATSHTAKSDDPWWEVDLGSAQELNKIVIWNRTDGELFSRLNHFDLTVLNDKRETVWQTRIDPAPNPSIELDLSLPRNLAFTGASDTQHRVAGGDFSAARTVAPESSPQSGWGATNTDRPHSAIFPLASALVGPADLTFTLVQNTPNSPIGRLRIYVTTHKPPMRAVPEEVSDVLLFPYGQRTSDQQERIFDYFLSVAPEGKARMDRLAELKKQLAESRPTYTAVMRELPKDQRRENHVLVKGNFLVKGAAVQPAVLAALNPLPSGAAPDRLGLARWITDRANPLTARVQVNRIWATLFGIGIVETQEDFGTQGQPPSNQALLDWMAVEFMDPSTGPEPRAPWDMKRLVRMIVTSSAYRQSSSVTPDLLQKDPRNRFISRGPRRRLEAELVRDQSLALSGLLSEKMFGPSIFPPQPEGLWQAAFNGDRTWPASAGEDKYRRGIYVFWRRTVPYPSLSAFDAPSREVCALRRIMTSTPLQAFVTLNDPVYVECSQALARRMMKDGGDTPASRAAFGLRLCLGRLPEPEQIDRVVALHQAELDHYRSNAADAHQMATDPAGPLPAGMAEDDAAAWTVCANVLLNMDGVLTNH